MNHREARQALIAASILIWGSSLNWRALQFAQAVSLVETGGQYGSACYSDLEHGEDHCGTNNWGSLQCPTLPPCPEGCFEATDTDTRGKPYQACFYLDATPADGAKRFLRRLFVNMPSVLRQAALGDYLEAVAAMRRGRYFVAPLERYQAAVERNVDLLVRALGEPRGEPRRSWAPFVAVALCAVGTTAFAYTYFRR